MVDVLFFLTVTLPPLSQTVLLGKKSLCAAPTEIVVNYASLTLGSVCISFLQFCLGDWSLPPHVLVSSVIYISVDSWTVSAVQQRESAI